MTNIPHCHKPRADASFTLPLCLLSPAPVSVCPQLRVRAWLVSPEPLVPRHTLFSNSGSLACLRLQFDVNRFWHFTRSHQSLLTLGLTSNFLTILPPLLWSSLMGLIKTGGILEWKLLFQYILFATTKYRNVLLSLSTL